MLLNIISGGIGSGKSDHLYSLILKNLKNNPDSNAVVIVPEQFSYTAEKTLSEKMDGLGPNRIEVLTFSRLVHHHLQMKNNLLPSGKMILLSKAAADVSEDNIYYKSVKKPGFISSLSELFSEFKRYTITSDDLEKAAPKNENTNKKLSSICEIYKKYVESFSDDMTDSDDSLCLFADLIQKSDIFKNTFFFIDDYNDFLPGHFSVIRSMLLKSRGVFVTLSMDKGDEDGLFAPVYKTKKRLFAIANSMDAQIYETELDKKADYIKSPEVRHLLENWDSKLPYSKKPEDITLFASRDLYSEVEHTAAEIISLVRDKGFRFRDIGVICGNISDYLHILNAVFADFKIPFFTDEKLLVTLHPIAKTVLSLFDIIAENWSYSSVFDYLRAGYIYRKDENGNVTSIPREDIDILENYVLKYGIKGKKAWFSPFTKCNETIFDEVIEPRYTPNFDLEMLNSLREEIILPFSNFLENKSHTVKSIAKATFDFMCAINLYDGIMKECKMLDDKGLRNESEQFRQVWNCLIETLDQMVTTMGQDVISRENFCMYFKSGLLECKIGIIPSGLDRVSIGTVERNSPTRVKVLFVIGATYGSIPHIPSNTGILSSLDRELINEGLSKEGLSKEEKELAPDEISKTLLENLKLYRVISTACEKLSVSYPLSDSEGSSLAQSAFVSDLKKIFPSITVLDNVIQKPSDAELLASSKRGFYYMLLKLSEYYREKPDVLWKEVFDWYAKNPEYKGKLDILKIAAEYKKNQPRLSKAKAQMLYGKNKKYSITLLEQFSKCPFSYYVERGLYVKPEETKTVETTHIGSLIHSAIEKFCEIVEKDATTIPEIKRAWETLSARKQDEIVHTVISDMANKILPNTGEDENKIDYLLSRCERTLKKSVETIKISLAKGGYVPVCREKGFEVSIDWKNNNVTLRGAIDRIDIMEDIASKRANIRIIDYKSGRKSFSISAICNKIDMQLVLYGIAAVTMYEKGDIQKTDSSLVPQVSAIMYNKISDDLVSISEPSAELAKSALKSHRKLDGIVILDEEKDEEKDESSYNLCDLANMDPDVMESGESDFLNIKIKTDGKSLYENSQVASRDTFNLLCSYMKKAVIDTDNAIKSGDISIRPCSGDANPCKYCNYKEICMFDDNVKGFRHLIKGKAEALEFIKKEVEEDEQN